MSFKFFDITVLNPLTWPRRIVNNIDAAGEDLNKGIWLGKKPIGNVGIGMTFSPVYDLFHWALLVNGVLYEIDVDKSDGNYCTTQSKAYIDRFKWIRLREYSGRSHSDMIGECKRIIRPYFFLTNNCQMFVIELFEYAANISSSEAAKEIAFQSGTALF